MSFENRADAGKQLGRELKRLKLHNPLILGIPRGGVVTAAAIANTLNAELDIVLAHKLRCPSEPELAIGAVGEDGVPTLDKDLVRQLGISQATIIEECRIQANHINRLKRLFRDIRPPATIAGRTVVITDDGIATGSTMLAALQIVRQMQPFEVIVAVPVAPPNRLKAIRSQCNRLICLIEPFEFYAVGQFYRSFESVSEEEVVQLLQEYASTTKTAQ
ncbi:phosphoribosyltransferase [bacterium]|nr:phosphoribosyltransferase [bacterium]